MKFGNKLTLLVALAAVFAGDASARASILPSVLVNGLNTFDDQDREAFYDNGDGVFGVGDVLVGFTRIDDHLPPTVNIENKVYGIFSQQITAVSGSVVTFGETTVSGLKLSDLIGVATPTGSMVAVFSGATPISNLISTSPGDLNSDSTVDLFDYFKEITDNLSLSLIAGFGSGATEVDDYFRAIDITGSLVGGPVGAISSIPNSVQVAAFHGGLSILLNNDPTVIYNELVPSTLGGTHQFAISNGAVRGSSGETNASEWGNIGGNPGGFATDGDYFVNATVVPEPSSILCWFGLSGLACIVITRRRNG